MNDKAMAYMHAGRRHGFGFLLTGFRLRRLFRHFVLRYVAPISRHPAMTLVTGFGLALSGTVELADQIFTEFDTAIGIHQGVILLGIVTFLRGVADLVEASEWLSKGSEEEEGQAQIGTAAR
ncbi:hypothetical protein [Rhizobium sp.]